MNKTHKALLRQAETFGYAKPSSKAGVDAANELVGMELLEVYDGYPGWFTITRAGEKALEREQEAA